jgi:hypothetical protein
LHQQRKQTLWRAKVAAEQRAVGVDGGHQRDAPKVMPLGHHLGAHQHVHVTIVHGLQVLLQLAHAACAVGVDTAYACRGQQGGQLLLQFFGAPAHG